MGRQSKNLGREEGCNKSIKALIKRSYNQDFVDSGWESGSKAPSCRRPMGSVGEPLRFAILLFL